MVCLFVWYVGFVGRLVCMVGRLVFYDVLGFYGVLGFYSGKLVCMVGWFVW